MDKMQTPAYSLRNIKEAFNNKNRLHMTVSARQGQQMLGFSDQDVVDTIQNLAATDFYKSMEPVKPGFTAWQDVYKTRHNGFEVYIKFQINTNGELILSFKEK